MGASLHAFRDEHTRNIEPALALATKTLSLEPALSDLVNQAYGLTLVAETELSRCAPLRE